MMVAVAGKYEVEFRKDGGKYKNVSGTLTLGGASGIYGLLRLAKGEHKRLVRIEGPDRHVITTEHGPSLVVREVPLNDTKLARAVTYEYGVLTSVATCNDDILPAVDENDACGISTAVKRNSPIKAVPVRRRIGSDDDTWRTFAGYRWDYQIDTWKGVRR